MNDLPQQQEEESCGCPESESKLTLDGSVPAVEITNLQTKFGRTVIHNDLNLTINNGEILSIVGGSGTGKTVLLRQMLGLERPTKGCVRVFGEDITVASQGHLQELRNHWGMLFQHGALFTDLTAFENVAFPLHEHTDLPEELIRDLVLMKLHAVGLRNAAYLKPAEVSGGMARRIAVARAIALDPPLIMYDEPFAGLDPISKGVTANLIRTLNDALGSTSILVSHDVQESLMIADYVYFLSRGKIVAQGAPDEINASDDPFFKQFVHAEADGPVPFHYPGRSLAEDLGLGGRP